MVVKFNNDLYSVFSMTHRTPGNLRGFVQARMRSLRSGTMIEHRFSSEDKVEKAVLEGALRRAAILAPNEMRMVRFEVGDKQMRMTAESSARGRADVSIDAVVKGAGGSINFNPDYILEAMRVSKLEHVRLDMSDDSMPAKFTLGESFTYVVMPISGS